VSGRAERAVSDPSACEPGGASNGNVPERDRLMYD
jgi:hypothetical protein